MCGVKLLMQIRDLLQVFVGDEAVEDIGRRVQSRQKPPILGANIESIETIEVSEQIVGIEEHSLPLLKGWNSRVRSRGFDDHDPWTPALPVPSPQYLMLMPFDIDAEELYRPVNMVFTDLGKCGHRHLALQIVVPPHSMSFGLLAAEGRKHRNGWELKQGSSPTTFGNAHVQIDVPGSLFREPSANLRHRLDVDSTPSPVIKVPGNRGLDWIIRANIDIESRTLRKDPLQEDVLSVLRIGDHGHGEQPRHSHRASTRSNPLFSGPDCRNLGHQT